MKHRVPAVVNRDKPCVPCPYRVEDVQRRESTVLDEIGDFDYFCDSIRVDLIMVSYLNE